MTDTERLDALVADLRGLTAKWHDRTRSDAMSGTAIIAITLDAAAGDVDEILDKHAGERSEASHLNCPVCGSGEEGDCVCALAEAFARAEWEASGRAIYESPWDQVSPMKKQYLTIKALPEAHEFVQRHPEGRCRPELCGGSKADPCAEATQ